MVAYTDHALRGVDGQGRYPQMSTLMRLVVHRATAWSLGALVAVLVLAGCGESSQSSRSLSGTVIVHDGAGWAGEPCASRDVGEGSTLILLDETSSQMRWTRLTEGRLLTNTDCGFGFEFTDVPLRELYSVAIKDGAHSTRALDLEEMRHRDWQVAFRLAD
jgi:hypothetical protein